MKRATLPTVLRNPRVRRFKHDAPHDDYKDAQDFEFTVDSGKLFLLQTRAANRAGLEAVKIAVDTVNEGLISREQAIQCVPSPLDESDQAANCSQRS